MLWNIKHQIDAEPGTIIRFSHEVHSLLTDKPCRYNERVFHLLNGVHTIRDTRFQGQSMINASSLLPDRAEVGLDAPLKQDQSSSEIPESIHWRTMLSEKCQESRESQSMNHGAQDNQSDKTNTSRSQLYETEATTGAKEPDTDTQETCNGKLQSTTQPTFTILKEQRVFNLLRNLGDEAYKLQEENICLPPHLFQSNGRALLVWLTIVAIAVLYNFWIPIARQAFYDINNKLFVWWIGMDACADLVYIADIGIQFSTTYLKQGLVVQDRRSLAIHYLLSNHFRLDIISIIPLDLLQFVVGIQPMLRFPRLIKVYRARQWKTKVENRASMPNLWRVVNLIHVLFLGCHWCACLYYIISTQQGFKTAWGYQPDAGVNETTPRTYLKAFYWSTLALTTIGVSTDPETNIELLFMCCTYLIGLFVFATVVGQVGNIINTRNAARLAMEEIMDRVKSYMQVNGVTPSLQKRILRWYEYAWHKRRLDGVGDISAFQMLPNKLRTELAIHVHLKTLKKVSIFQECSPEFLQDLVLHMKSVIFTPGDYVCKKGEIAREMFIINDGVLEVVGANGFVLATMKSGDYFGEIGILNLDGKNRRTADVRAVGYADLLTLTRSDVLAALQDHPDAEVYMIRSARRRLQGAKDAAHMSRPTSVTHYNLEAPQKNHPQSSDASYEEAPSTSSSVTVADLKLNRLAWTKQRQTERMNALIHEFSRDFRTLLMNIVDTYEEEIKKLTDELSRSETGK